MENEWLAIGSRRGRRILNGWRLKGQLLITSEGERAVELVDVVNTRDLLSQMQRAPSFSCKSSFLYEKNSCKRMNLYRFFKCH